MEGSSDYLRLHEEIGHDITNIYLHRHLFSDLYGKSQERIDLFNKLDETIAHVLHDTLIEKIILEINKLLDHPTTGKQQNLCLERLVMEMKDEKERKRFLGRLKAVRSQAERFLTIRHKRISHNDFRARMEPLKLGNVSRAEITNVMASVADLNNPQKP